MSQAGGAATARVLGEAAEAVEVADGPDPVREPAFKDVDNVRDCIMVIDPDRNVRQMIERVLQPLVPDGEVILESDGNAGWSKIQSIAKDTERRVILIVCAESPESRMPGHEVLRNVQSTAGLKEVPFILTHNPAHGGGGEVQKIIAGGKTRVKVMLKPIDSDEQLFGVARELLAA